MYDWLTLAALGIVVGGIAFTASLVLERNVGRRHKIVDALTILSLITIVFAFIACLATIITMVIT